MIALFSKGFASNKIGANNPVLNYFELFKKSQKLSSRFFCFVFGRRQTIVTT
jgi:hypothetical protein